MGATRQPDNRRDTPMRNMIYTLLISSTLLVFTGVTNAHMGANGIVQERMELMKSIGKAMKGIRKMARGKVPLKSAKVASAAKEIAHHGARIGALFPQGSAGGVSEASPKIWEDPANFQKSSDLLVQTANNLFAAAQSNDPAKVKSAFRALGRTCGSCHTDFRIKKAK